MYDPIFSKIKLEDFITIDLTFTIHLPPQTNLYLLHFKRMFRANNFPLWNILMAMYEIDTDTSPNSYRGDTLRVGVHYQVIHGEPRVRHDQLWVKMNVLITTLNFLVLKPWINRRITDETTRCAIPHWYYVTSIVNISHLVFLKCF